MEQTFITELQDENGMLVDFERWQDKRQSTVERKIATLYSEKSPYRFLYSKHIDRAATLVIWATPTPDKYIEVKRYNKAELMRLIS
ncbi:MAG: hypothetical protein AB7D36_05505 [Oscillospiraceae bacterium]